MPVQPFRIVSVLLGLSFALWLSLTGIHAQEATPAATAAVQFDLPQTYRDSLYTVNYPEGWITQTAPGAVALMTDSQVLTLTQRFGVPPLTHEQITIEIMTGILGKVISNPPSQITNVNCTSCHLLEQAAAPVNGVEPVSALTDVADTQARRYSGDPFHFPFGRAQALKLGSVDAAEATFTSKNDDGLLIELYANQQLVSLLALAPAGDLVKAQPLIEAIASTIQAVEATPEAAATNSP